MTAEKVVILSERLNALLKQPLRNQTTETCWHIRDLVKELEQWASYGEMDLSEMELKAREIERQARILANEIYVQRHTPPKERE